MKHKKAWPNYVYWSSSDYPAMPIHQFLSI
jgi:hypothetical protein